MQIISFFSKNEIGQSKIKDNEAKQSKTQQN